MKKIDCYVISFDESLNDMTKNCCVDILFRFFELSFATDFNLFDQFRQGVSKLHLNKMYQISMDGSSANLNFLKKVNKDQVLN